MDWQSDQCNGLVNRGGPGDAGLAASMHAVDYYGNCWLPARKFVEDAVTKRMEVDPSGEIIVLERVRKH
eukprot:scaffold394650_cov44-Prasinocladus_malaysianus.AAC.1